jgi:hypothetical protein
VGVRIAPEFLAPNATHACNLTNLILVINSVHDSIRTKNDLANVVTLIFRNDATNLCEFLQSICLGNQFVSERQGTVGIVARSGRKTLDGTRLYFAIKVRNNATLMWKRVKRPREVVLGEHISRAGTARLVS